MRRIVALLLSFGISLNAQAQSLSELQEREEISITVRSLFLAEDFHALEELSDTYRSTKERTSSGLWRLTPYYSGLNAAIDDDRKSLSSDLVFYTTEARVQRWVAEFPDSPSAQIAYAMLLVARGWAFRGNQYARQVSPESWEPFRHYLALARKQLEDHKSSAAIDPQWYKVMIWVAKGQSWDFIQFAELLDEALAREPLYYETYFSALEYLLPKWHGSAFEIEVFAQDAAQRTVAHEGTGMYARIYWYASQVQFGNELFSESLVDWPLMRQGFEDVIAKYPDAWNLNNFAKFACLARDKNTTRALFGQVQEDFMREAWEPISLYTECSLLQLLP